MPSQEVFFAVYGLCGIVIVAAAWRIIRRRRVEVNAKAIATSPSIENAISILKPQPSAAARSTSRVSWTDRRLFAELDPLAERRGNDLPTIEPESVPGVDTRDWLFGALTPVLAALLPESEARRAEVRKELKAAGYYGPHAYQNFAAIRYLSTVLPLIVCGVLLVLVSKQFEGPVLGFLVTLPVVGWALPRVYLRSRGAERRNQIERSMPDVLDMLNMCVSQGLTVEQALRRITTELRDVYPVLAQELQIVAEQTELGGLDLALENFSDRADVPDVRALTSLLRQTERLGTSISAALTEHSDSLRESLRQRADEKGNRATFKLLFPTVLCLMPAVYLFLLGPAVIELSDFLSNGRESLNARQQQALERINR